MDRKKINFIAATVSIVLGVQALVVVILSIFTGWDRGLPDEGAAAHIFQILILAEAFSTVAFLWTSDLARVRQVIQIIGIQVAIFAVTFATGSFFKL